MGTIKCNICKLDNKTCETKCIDMDDTSKLLAEGKTYEDALRGFCTNHSCQHNPSGFRCIIDKCILL